MKNIIINIEQRMQEVLNNAQMEYLHKILIKFLETENSENKEENSKKQTCFYNLSEVVLQFKS